MRCGQPRRAHDCPATPRPAVCPGTVDVRWTCYALSVRSRVLHTQLRSPPRLPGAPRLGPSRAGWPLCLSQPPCARDREEGVRHRQAADCDVVACGALAGAQRLTLPTSVQPVTRWGGLFSVGVSAWRCSVVWTVCGRSPDPRCAYRAICAVPPRACQRDRNAGRGAASMRGWGGRAAAAPSARRRGSALTGHHRLLSGTAGWRPRRSTALPCAGREAGSVCSRRPELVKLQGHAVGTRCRAARPACGRAPSRARSGAISGCWRAWS